MKIINLAIVATFIIFLYGCRINSDIKEIEDIFELEIPDCYVRIENETEKIELNFEEKCFDQFLDSLGNPFSKSSKYYRGTDFGNQMIYINEMKSAKLYINYKKGILIFERGNFRNQ